MKTGVFCITFVGTVFVSSLSQSSGAPKVHSTGFPPDLTLGDETGALCVVKKEGRGRVSISWRKDGAEIESNGRITVAMQTTSSSTLTIRRIEPGDIGNYTCEASSVQGSSEITVPLAVVGKHSIIPRLLLGRVNYRPR
ncbi:unnamed protein product [Ixodes pacificus]